MADALSKDTLSDHWRINRSQFQRLEQVEVLRSLRKLLGFHGVEASLGYITESTRQVAYVRHDTGTILINPRTVKESPVYPIGAESFDVLCGLTIHEIGHIVSGSGTVDKRVAGSYSVNQRIIKLVADMGEEYVADNYFGKRSKQRKYIRTSRAYYNAEREQFRTVDNPMLDAINAYTHIVIYESPMLVDLTDKAKEILLIMLSEFNSRGLLKKSKEPEVRYLIYADTATKIAALFQHQAQKERMADPRGKRMRAGYVKERDEKRRVDSALDKVEQGRQPEWSKVKLSDLMTKEESAEIQELQDQEVTDVSDLVAALVGQSRRAEGEHSPPRHLVMRDISKAIISSIVSAGETRYWEPDKELVKELAWLKTVKLSKDTVVLRGLEAGKVDKRRLHRAPIDGLVFKQDYMKKEGQKNIWLLMDNSGSMSGWQGDKLYQMCAAVHEVLPKTRIYTYESTGSTTNIVRVDDQGMKRLSTGGVTPSGDAIVFVGNLLQKMGGGLLIHFTDGNINAGVGVEDTYRVIKHKLPNLVLINAAQVITTWQTLNTPPDRVQNIEIHNPKEFSQLLRESIGKAWGLL